MNTMKRIVLVVVILVSAVALFATDFFWDGLSDVARYDLADAYKNVAERFAELGDDVSAKAFRDMAQTIYPGIETARRPRDTATTTKVPVAAPMLDPGAEEAVVYYWKKLARGVFNENVSLINTVIADRIYVPLYEEGLDRESVNRDLVWFFENYDTTVAAPETVFEYETIRVVPLDNGYWRLDVEVADEYVNVLAMEITFWGKSQGYYFRQFPEGWRLAAIGIN